MRLWPLETRPTPRSGMLFIASIASLYGILSTQNNLLYLVFAVLVSVLAVGWIGPAWLSRGIRVARFLPPAVHEGSEASLRVAVSNENRTFRTPPLVLEALERPGERAVSALVGALAPGARAEFPVLLRFPRRGRRALDRVGLCTPFPLGLKKAKKGSKWPFSALQKPQRASGRPQAREIAFPLAKRSS